MKFLFLLPPSEWKKSWWEYKTEKLSFKFEKPCEIATTATEKDLKCKWDRYKEAVELNRTLCDNSQKEFTEAIKRYSGVMYWSIDYENMDKKSQEFFEQNFLIFSGIYGILRPKDIIWNYKLPLGKADLYKFWWDKIPEAIIELKPDFIVNLLPINYAKLIGLGTNCSRHKKKLAKILDSRIKIVNINFLAPYPNLSPQGRKEEKKYKKISHWVKKIKGEWIKNICEKNIVDYKDFWWEIVDNWNWIIDVNIIKK